ncbi:uncharacterized protein PG998_010877 [Apiospora kogelbergensis]|uniref:Uncharacterized protein n=1 Tax=Apiospora kogelbergensis TaxID=1337665 RepID=A0AAW0RDP3_9PEZI
MALPLFLEGDDPQVMLLSDSEDESDDNMPVNPPTRNPNRIVPDADPTDEAALKQKTEDAAANVPAHPIPAMQAPFAESLVEATTNSADLKPKLKFAEADERRACLLDAAADAGLPADLWRHRPGHVHHELWKLMAQISFGVYLLLGGMANSNIQVVNILQGHIDEVDEFLETAMEDVQSAIVDVEDRIKHLELPMENRDTFEKMLEDHDFRLQIVTGNEKIEHICLRSSLALEAYLDDVEEGLKATKEFAMYLNDQQARPWRQERPSVVEIFDAMKGNAEGWYKAFVDLQDISTNLESMLEKLSQMVAEMDKLAGEVSRRPIGNMSEVVPENPDEEDTIDDSFLDDYLEEEDLGEEDLGGEFLGDEILGEEAFGGEVLGQDVFVGEESSGQKENKDDAFQLDLRASALMPLQFGLDSFPEPPHTGNESTVISKPASINEPSTADYEPASTNSRYWAGSSHASEASGRSSPRTESSRSRPCSDAHSQAHSAPTSPKSPSQKSPPSSPAAKDLLPQTYYQPPTKRESTMNRGPTILIAPEPVIVEDEYDDDDGSFSLDEDDEAPSPTEDQGLYILQPRTYTPLPPEPLPSPMVRNPTSPLEIESPKQESPPRRTSLRQRLSLRGSNPPVSIQVPPRNANRPRPPPPPRVSTYQETTSVYVPEQGQRQPMVHSVSDSFADLPPPGFPNRSNPIPSPLSDHHHFRPVQASPHSPLQRPWTSGNVNPVVRPHTSATTRDYYQGHHQRNTPSAMTSRLSNVSTLNPENGDGKTLKKKRSAFGWLKKAFALDEEERMAFEARKQQQAPMPYYDERSPRFLDGRRLDEHRRY